RYGLVWNFKRSEAPQALERLKALLNQPNLYDESQAKRQRLLADKVDATDWMMEFVDSVVAK
ncbi:MAG: hypothetical protein MK135_17880, partial [Polyangiaceae bacterium]|nr:hypothetical protein [Polyangiaceae bacterium]